MVTLELVLKTHPTAVFMPANYLPPEMTSILRRISSIDLSNFYLLPFQTISLARRASITIHIFISQLTPPEIARGALSGSALSGKTIQGIVNLLHLSRATDAEANRLLQLGLTPFRGDSENVNSLRREMRDGLVLSSIRGSPEVQEAVKQARRRRHGDTRDQTPGTS